MEIQHIDNGITGKFYIEQNAEEVAELLYKWVNEKHIIIKHTEVNDVLKGQGIANKLLDACIVWARENNLKITPECPFAKAMFERKKEFGDVLFH